MTATALALTLGCAPHAGAQTPSKGAAAPPASRTVEDPLEPINRFFYKVNGVIDRAVLKPLALGYEHRAPRPVQSAIRNVVNELSEPLGFVNDVLQAKPKQAARTLARFITNATVGLAGLFDPAKKLGIPHHDNGFGVTLGTWGVKPGPYVYLPLLGPSNFRDLIGVGVDTYSDPIRLINYPHSTEVTIGVLILGGLDERARAEGDLEQIEQMGTDPYATLRSLYMQNRQSQIRGDQPLNINELPDLGDMPPVAPAAPGTPASAAPDAPAPAAPPAAAPEAAPAAPAAAPQPPASEPAPAPSAEPAPSAAAPGPAAP